MRKMQLVGNRGPTVTSALSLCSLHSAPTRSLQCASLSELRSPKVSDGAAASAQELDAAEHGDSFEGGSGPKCPMVPQPALRSSTRLSMEGKMHKVNGTKEQLCGALWPWCPTHLGCVGRGRGNPLPKAPPFREVPWATKSPCHHSEVELHGRGLPLCLGG